jgi:magnesium transporter
MGFEISKEILESISLYVENKNDKALSDLFSELHYADITEILDQLTFDEAIYIIKLLDSETTSDVLSELDEDISSKILENLSAKEIAEEVAELDTDDAVDLLGELPEERKENVIAQLDDEELVADIQELLTYKDDTAGGLMAKELVKVYETWTVAGCLRKIRAQAKNVTRVHSIYVVDKEDKLVGRLSLKDLIIARSDQKIADIAKSKVDSVNVNLDDEEVAKIMAKYDLEAVPVIEIHS